MSRLNFVVALAFASSILVQDAASLSVSGDDKEDDKELVRPGTDREGNRSEVGSGDAAPADCSATPVLVEMFLSQSCSSCVPAAHFVSDLAQREDVVVLSWHVDYWDTLNVAGRGRWKDPYSNPEFTQRQRRYASSRFQTGRVYTPQAVIDGFHDAVGSDRKKITTLIDDNSTGPAFCVTARKGEVDVVCAR